jgi:hypothetical protein
MPRMTSGTDGAPVRGSESRISPVCLSSTSAGSTTLVEVTTGPMVVVVDVVLVEVDGGAVVEVALVVEEGTVVEVALVVEEGTVVEVVVVEVDGGAVVEVVVVEVDGGAVVEVLVVEVDGGAVVEVVVVEVDGGAVVEVVVVEVDGGTVVEVVVVEVDGGTVVEEGTVVDVGGGVPPPQNWTFEMSGVWAVLPADNPALENDPLVWAGVSEVMTEPNPPFTTMAEIATVEVHVPPVAVALRMLTTFSLPAGCSNR